MKTHLQRTLRNNLIVVVLWFFSLVYSAFAYPSAGGLLSQREWIYGQMANAKTEGQLTPLFEMAIRRASDASDVFCGC